MLRTTIVRTARPLAARRLFTTTRAVMAAGDVGSGASRPEGDRAGDAFTKRERAQEELYIREEEKRKLLAIRQKLKEQQKHIEELDKHIADLTRDQGGEQN